MNDSDFTSFLLDYSKDFLGYKMIPIFQVPFMSITMKGDSEYIRIVKKMSLESNMEMYQRE